MVVIALWRVAVALGPARIVIAVPAVLIRSLSLVTRTAPKRRRTIVIAIARRCSGSAPVVIAVVVPGATVASTARLIATSSLIARVEITRVEIKHSDLRMNQSPWAKRWLQWSRGLARTHHRQSGCSPRQGVHPWYANSRCRGPGEPGRRAVRRGDPQELPHAHGGGHSGGPGVCRRPGARASPAPSCVASVYAREARCLLLECLYANRIREGRRRPRRARCRIA